MEPVVSSWPRAGAEAERGEGEEGRGRWATVVDGPRARRGTQLFVCGGFAMDGVTGGGAPCSTMGENSRDASDAATADGGGEEEA